MKDSETLGNTASDMPLIMSAFMQDDNIIIKSEVSSHILVNVLIALLTYCTDEMLVREKVLKDKDETANFILGAYLIANRMLQDSIYQKLDNTSAFGKEDEGGVKFV